MRGCMNQDLCKIYKDTLIPNSRIKILNLVQCAVHCMAARLAAATVFLICSSATFICTALHASTAPVHATVPWFLNGCFYKSPLGRTRNFYKPWSASMTPLCKLRVTKQ